MYQSLKQAHTDVYNEWVIMNDCLFREFHHLHVHFVTDDLIGNTHDAEH